jgi:hypothetical protein
MRLGSSWSGMFTAPAIRGRAELVGAAYVEHVMALWCRARARSANVAVAKEATWWPGR